MTDDAAHRRPRSRRLPASRRGRLLLAGVSLAAVVAVVLVSLTVVRGNAWDSRVQAQAAGGVISVTGTGFPPSGPVDVSARVDGGGGSGVVMTDGEGTFALAFRVPAGFVGRVDVSAVTPDTQAQGTVAAHPGDPAEATAGDGSAVTPGGTSDPASSSTVIPITGAPAVPAAFPDSGLPRFTVPRTIAADCSADVTDALNAWLRSIPDNSQIDFPAQACYRVDGSLLLASRNDLVVDGNGATFRAETKVPSHDTERAQWRLDYGSRITLRNMTLVGVNPVARFDHDNEFDHNLFVRGTHTVTIDNVHGRNAYGDFISIAHGADGVAIPSDITISHVTADTIGRMGIACVACDGMSVSDSVLNNIALHAFDLEIEGDGRPGRKVTFTDNTVEKHGLAFFSVGTPFQTYDNDLSDVTITGNRMTEPGSSIDECIPAVSFLYSKIPARNVVIEGNQLMSRTDAVMVKNASGVSVQDNSFVRAGPPCGDPVGVRTVSVTDAAVSGNQSTGYHAEYRAG